MIPTNGAPKTYEELVKLLEKDNKIKVAGKLDLNLSVEDDECVSRYRR